VVPTPTSQEDIPTSELAGPTMNALLWEELDQFALFEKNDIVIKDNDKACETFLQRKQLGQEGKPRVAQHIFEEEAAEIMGCIERSVSDLARENVASKVFTHSIFSTELTIVVDEVGKWELETDFANQVIYVTSPLSGKHIYEWTGSAWINAKRDCYLTGFLMGEFNHIDLEGWLKF